MTDHNRTRTTFLGLVIEALGAAPTQINVLEATFQGGVGQALRVTVAEVPADDQRLIRFPAAFSMGVSIAVPHAGDLARMHRPGAASGVLLGTMVPEARRSTVIGIVDEVVDGTAAH